MNGVKENNRIRQYIVPVLAATAIMVLVFMTVPLTGIPATVRGAYGGGGGGGGTTGVTTGVTGVIAPSVISLGCPKTLTIMIMPPNASQLDIPSVTFAGMLVKSWYYDTNSNLVLIFDLCNCSLKPGDTTALLTGKFINGTPFQTVAYVVVQ